MKKALKILVVEDEADLREILEFNLANEGFLVKTVASGEEALKLSLEEYNLLLLDVMMSGISGYKLADILRKEKKLSVPFIFLTAKGEENDLLTGFSLGGDDYIVKPFSLKELVVRIRAVLKRTTPNAREEKPLAYEELIIDASKRIVSLDRKSIDLTRKEYEILVLLLEHIGEYISREEIMKRVWGEEVIVTDRNVDVTITRLRKKIGRYGQNLKGKTGFGYRFNES